MSFLLSPIYSLGIGHFFTFIIVISLYGAGFYKDSAYFSWGCPIVFFDVIITSTPLFYVLLGITFFHQLTTNLVYDVVYPWIINTVQNPRNTVLEYSKGTCLAIINFNSLYNQIHLAFIISSITSQVSFLIVLIIADFITLTYINWQYIKPKTVGESAMAEEIEPEVEIV
jgi:hypothetical protein